MIEFYKPDVVAVVESWLTGEDEVVMDGYGSGTVEDACTRMQ